MPARRPRIAVVACEERPELDDDWGLLAPALEAAGADPALATWTDDDVAWGDYDLVVVRGTWDYTTRVEEFAAWTEKVTAGPATLVNPGEVLRWNADKRYLADLAASGLPVIPTTWVAPGESWVPPAGEYVVKPTISAGARDTARYGAPAGARGAGGLVGSAGVVGGAGGADGAGGTAAADAHVRRLHAAGLTVMIQPYQASVDVAGETALIFLGGELSHAVRKGALLEVGAAAGDWLWPRERITPLPLSAVPAGHVETATAAVRWVDERLGATAYARIDLVDDRDGRPLILEVEVIEPCLFLMHAPGAAERFAGVLRALAG